MPGRYELRFDRRASKELARIPDAVKARIAKALATLTHTPRPVGAVKLTGSDLYRVRIGDYRAVYAIKDDALVLILQLSRRGTH